MPISFCKKNGLVVIVGDPNQLGPMPHSPTYRCIPNAMVSLQERLLRFPVYSDLVLTAGSTHNAGRSGVVLVNNYRSHEDIFAVSSRLFYGGQLIQCGIPVKVNYMIPWTSNYLLRKNSEVKSAESAVPISSAVLVVGCDGKHQHELDSPSYFNLAEVGKVCDLCVELLHSPVAPGISTNDIGVIAAYRHQVLKIRNELRLRGCWGINVGSVEDYQGKEVKIAIVSTVLTADIDAPENFGLFGLMHDRRRFNVAVTRGECLTIVVGNLKMLQKDRYFNEYLLFCRDKRAYTGEIIDEIRYAHNDNGTEDEDSKLLSLAGSISLGHGKGEKFDPIESYYRDDIAWRMML